MNKNAMVVSGEQRLAELAGRINEEHQLCEQSFREGLQHAIGAGELLIEARALCKHGEWLDWLTANCEVSERTAQAYMRVARNRDLLGAKAQHVADLSFHDAVMLLAESKPETGRQSAYERVHTLSKDVLNELRFIVDSPDATLDDLVKIIRIAGQLYDAWAEIRLRCEWVLGKLLNGDADLQSPLSDSQQVKIERLEGFIESTLKGSISQELHSRYLELSFAVAA